MLAADVRALLDAYSPVDVRESRFRDRMLSLTEHPHPFARSTFGPGHFTASAFVLSPERDALALIFHRKLGLWLQPGGHIEPGDRTARGAAAREVEEEIGLWELLPLSDGLFDLDVHVIPAHGEEAAHEHFDLRLAFVSGTRELRPSAEVAGARWASFAEITDLTPDESVRRAVRKLG